MGVTSANSRDSVAGAGWNCEARPLETLFRPERPEKQRRPFSWLQLRSLLLSRNDVLARRLGDPTPEQRNRWLDDWYGDRRPDLRVATGLRRASFLLLGDTGEGDASQYAVLAGIDRFGAGTDFLVVCSDVVYPAGEIAEYEDKFFYPYRNYPRPIYALPGNHDWYDDLRGFMFHFCGREGEVPTGPKPPRFSKAGLRARLWHRASPPPDAATLARMRRHRGSPEQQARLPGPYFVIETDAVDLVAIDTGITNGLDAEQGRWLKRVSASSEKPKILLTGKPLIVNGRRAPCRIEGGGSVDDLLRDPAHNYVATIGGDVHNYQRYLVDVQGRELAYIVSGGGGAFTHATHRIRKVDLPGTDERRFRCYPLRGDSLSFYSTLWDRRPPVRAIKRLPRLDGSLRIDPEQAAAYMAERLGMVPTKPQAASVEVTAQTRARAAVVFPAPGRARGPWHAFSSEWFDSNDPPLFKHLLRVDADSDRIRIACHAATGCVGDTDRAPEDVLVATPAASGAWRWQVEG